jgi:flagellar motor switch/type III secretory pathway protein FliN
MEDSNPATAPAVQTMAEAPEEDPWAAVLGLTCKLEIALPVPAFRVRDLLSLDIETLIDSGVNSTGPVPVWVNGITIGLAEFDVLGRRVAMRIKELA